MSDPWRAPTLQRPVYGLAIHAAGCPYQVRINDCPVTEDEDGYVLTTTMPANRWLRSGLNILSITLQPWARCEGKCRVRVVAGEAERWPHLDMVLAEASLEVPAHPGEEVDLSLLPPPVSRHLTFAASLPSRRWAWDAAPAWIPLMQADRDAILDGARAFWRCLDARDLPGLEALWQEKTRELCQAQHQTEPVRLEFLRANMNQLLDRTEWELTPFVEDDLLYRMFAHGRLVHLVDRGTGESPIYFLDPEKQVASYIDLFFYNAPGAGWRIIR